jgi:hypothetical protein
MRPDHSGSKATTQPRRNRNHRPDDDHRYGDGTPPMLVESGKPVRALAARPEDAQRDKDRSHRESDATHTERIVGPMTSSPSRTRPSGTGTLASFWSTAQPGCVLVRPSANVPTYLNRDPAFRVFIRNMQPGRNRVKRILGVSSLRGTGALDRLHAARFSSRDHSRALAFWGAPNHASPGTRGSSFTTPKQQSSGVIREPWRRRGSSRRGHRPPWSRERRIGKPVGFTRPPSPKEPLCLP